MKFAHCRLWEALVNTHIGTVLYTDIQCTAQFVVLYPYPVILYMYSIYM
jgi:hypothetical protein